MNSHINNNTTSRNYLQIVETFPTYTNGNFTYLDNNFAYTIFNTNSSIVFKEDTPCELLIVGAGGRGGKFSLFGGAGGGGSGQIIYDPNITFFADTYDIKIGIDSPNSNDRISKISTKTQEIISAIGGGDGAYWDGISLGTIQRFPPNIFTSYSPIIKTIFNNNPCYKSIINIDSNYYEILYSSRKTDTSFDAINLFNYLEPQLSFETVFLQNQYRSTGTTYDYKQANFLAEFTYKGDWVCIKLPIPYSLTSYTFVQNKIETGGAPNNYKIYGSIDGITWTVIKERNSLVPLSYTNLKYTDNTLPQNLPPYLYFGLVVRSILTNIGYLNLNEWILFGRPIIITSLTTNGGSSIFNLPSNQTQGGIGGSYSNENLIQTIIENTVINIPYDNHYFNINHNSNSNININSGTYNIIINEGFIYIDNQIYQSFPILQSGEPEYWYKFNSSSGILDNMKIIGNISTNVNDLYFSYGSYLIPSINQLSSLNGITFTFWINPELQINNYLWIFKTIENPNDYLSFHGNNFKICNDNIITTVNFNIDIYDGLYHHIVCGINPSGKIFISCDGILFENSLSNSFSNKSYINGQIGEFYQGFLKDFRIYLRILNFDEINELSKGRIDIFYNRYTELITTTKIQISSGGLGGSSSSIPMIKNNYGDGGDGNNGLGFQGVVIIKYPYPNFNSVLTPYKFPTSQFLKFSGLNNSTGIQFKLLENKTDNRKFSFNDLEFHISSNNPFIYSTSNINFNGLYINSNSIGFGTNNGVFNSFNLNDFSIEKYNSNISFSNPSGFHGIGTTNPLNFLDIRNDAIMSKLNINSFQKTNPIAWYKFDDENNLGKDELNSYNLILINNPTFNSTIFNKGIGCISLLRDYNQYLIINNLKLNNLSFSISLWSFLLNYDDQITPIFYKGSDYDFFIIAYTSNNTIVFGFNGNNLSIENLPDDTNIWINWVFTYDDDKKRVIIYRNGNIILDEYFPYIFHVSHNYSIGRSRRNNIEKYFDGNIDDFRIYDEALNSTQVQDLFNGSNQLYSYKTTKNDLNVFGNCFISGVVNANNLIVNGNIFNSNNLNYFYNGWDVNTSNIYNLSTNIGIGTTNPRIQNRLDVYGRIYCNEIYVNNVLLTNNFVKDTGTTVDRISYGTLKIIYGGTNSNSFSSNFIINTKLLWSNNSLTIPGNLNNFNIGNEKILLNDGIKIGQFLFDKYGISNSNIQIGNNFFINSNFNIGLGTTNPLNNFDINGDISIKQILISSNLSNNDILNGQILNVSNIIINNSGFINRTLSKWGNSSNNNYMSFVGIGKTNPENSLDVSSNLEINGILNVNNISNINFLNGITMISSNINISNNVINFKNSNIFIGSRWNLNNSSITHNSSFIGIGTNNLTNRLNVGGNINMKGVLKMNNSNISNIELLSAKTLIVSNLNFLINSVENINFINGNTFNLNNWNSNLQKIYYNYGNLGIGSTNPLNSIDINGDFNFSGSLSISNNQILNIERNSNFIITNCNINSNLINNSYSYYQFSGSNFVTFNRDLFCDLLIVGAGGNGGKGSYSGGGGAGEVIYQPNYLFKRGSYNFISGINSINPNSRISSNSNDLLIAVGGGNGNIINDPIIISGTDNKIFIATDNVKYTYAIFRNSGGLTIRSDMKCDILIVGGGGGGGSRHGGGGGAGAVIYLKNQLLLSGGYNVTIGAGGTNVSSAGNGGNGGDTFINYYSSTIYLAKGGGFGAYPTDGGDGGSGGGSGGYSPGNPVNTNIPSGIYGNKGGEETTGNDYSYGGGGGGGASSAGANSTLNGSSLAIAGNGGNGIPINITGLNVYYGGGGGGGCSHNSASAGLGGLGGGGTGSKGATTATNGTANTGGGGGGAGFNSGNNGTSGSGGSGVVIIRYLNNLTRRYPPKGWTTITVESDALLNGQLCRKVDFTLDTTDISYGSGTYTIFYIPNTNDYQYNAQILFNYDENDVGGHLGGLYDITTGIYNGEKYLVDVLNKGDWFVIKLPTMIVLSSYYLVERNSVSFRKPKIFRLYGSTNGINWTLLDIEQNAIYISNKCYKSVTNYNSYNFYGLVINGIYGGGSDGVCNFAEFVINEQDISINMNNYTSSENINTFFTYTGTIQYFTVPSNVTSINIFCWGAGGGSGFNQNNKAGGDGGFVKATLNVTPNSVLSIIVGQGGRSGVSPGSSGTAFGGGGNGNAGTGWSLGSGGGLSGIFVTNANMTMTGTNNHFVNSNATPIIIAGAGGASGGYSSDFSIFPGGNGGSSIGNNSGTNGEGGKGATLSAGGEPGSGNTGPGIKGALFTGGSGHGTWGGGGGGGYYGGGGGGVGNSIVGGGGGGSSYLNTGSFNITNILNLKTETNNSRSPPGINEYLYQSGVGVGAAAGNNNGGNGLVIIQYIGQTGSGGGSYLNLNNQTIAVYKSNNIYSYVSSGKNGTLIKGGDGGSSTLTNTYNLTGLTNQIIAIGGSGATINSTPIIKTTFGSGGDGNGGMGTNGIIILKFFRQTFNINFSRKLLLTNNNYSILNNINPVIWYKFEDNSNQMLIDSSGNNNTLTNINNATFDNNIYIKGNGSISFNANFTQYLTNPSTTFNISNRDFSVTFWAYPQSSTNGTFILLGIDGNNTGVFICYGLTGLSQYYNAWAFGNYNVGNDQISSVFNDVNKWVHIAYTVNSTTKNRILYRNGIKIAEGTTINNLSTSSSAIFIGAIPPVTSYKSTGKLDDFRIYDICLSSSQIQDLYENSKTNVLINGNIYSTGSNFIFSSNNYPLLTYNNNSNILNPIIWYKFDTNSTQMLLDSSGNNYNLTNNLASFDNFNFNSKDFSICFWIKRTMNNRRDEILVIGSMTSPLKSIEIAITNNNKIAFNWWLEEFITDDSYLDAGFWVQLCFTYKTGTKIKNIYRNGVNIKSGSTANEVNVDNNIQIGADLNSRYLQGLLDDFRIYDFVLTPTQILELYNGRIDLIQPLNYTLPSSISVTGTGNSIRKFNYNLLYNFAYFTGPGNFIINSNLICDILIVGGGGGGGTGGAGGGAGNVLYITDYNLSAGTYSITVGSGGTGAATSITNGTNGGNSSMTINGITYTAIGGGGGGSRNDASGAEYIGRVGNSGGSGGGGSHSDIVTPVNIGGISTKNTYTGWISLGNSGGIGKDTTTTGYGSGGGGGAGGVGANAGANSGGNGGLGVNLSSIFGTNVGDSGWFGGGGGGGSYTGTSTLAGYALGFGNGGSGLLGGGGSAHSGNGIANTGGGGGGANFSGIGGNGGSGIVIIKYLSSNLNITSTCNLLRLNQSSILKINYSNDIYLNPGVYNINIFPNIINIDDTSSSYFVRPWGAYFANDWFGTTLVDSSGNQRHATTSGTITKTTASGNGLSAAITYISGGTSATISWPTGSIPSTFTILSFTRYTGGQRERILQGQTTNFLHGHWDGFKGVAHYSGWLTEYTGSSPGNIDDWLCMIGNNNGANLLADGVIRGTGGGTGNDSLRINLGNHSNEPSDWALSCVIIYDRIIPNDYSVKLNGFIDSYKLTGNLNVLKSNILGNSYIQNSFTILKEINGNTINPYIWYKFENDSNQMLLDSSGNNFNLINNNGVSFDNYNYIKGNGSAYFNYSLSQFLSISKSFNLYNIQSVNGISFTFWFNMNTINTGGSGWPRIFDFNNGTTSKYILCARNGNENKLVFSLGSNYYTNNNYVDGKWHHVVWNISKTGKWEIYIDNSIPTFTVALPSSSNIHNDIYTHNYFGKSAFTADGYYSGNIDDFRIYNFNLTSAQVLELYNGRIDVYKMNSTTLTTTSNSLILPINTLTKFNYQDEFNLNPGKYDFKFNNGIISINSNIINDYSYPILKDSNNNIINPIAWYKFDDSTNLGKDETNNYNLTNKNSVLFNSSDFVKGLGSTSFNGYNNYLNNSIAFNLNSKDFSISFWIKRDSNNRHDEIMVIGNSLSSLNLIDIAIYDNDKIAFNWWLEDFTTDNAYLDAGTWVHLCFTYKTGTKIKTIYRNGISIKSGTTANEVTTANELCIGADINSRFFKGLLDDFRIYSGLELTSNQILELYNGRIELYNGNILNFNSYPILKDLNNNSINPTAWYKFDDSTNLGKDSMNTYNLTNYNSVGYNSTNVIKGSGTASFDSGYSRYLLGTGVNINNKSFSISFWVYPINITDYYIYAKNNNTSVRAALHIGYRNANNFTFAFYGDDLDVPVSNHVNNWNFFTLTYNFSNNQRIIYINGILAASGNSQGPLNSPNQDYNIGRSFVESGYFTGLLDDFRIYTEIVLTQSQVLELYIGRVDINDGNSFTNIPSIKITGINNTINFAVDNSNYKYAIFNSNGTFVVDNNIFCDILIVGGGGGGGGGFGAGGGAGALIYKTNHLLFSGTYTINIGTGGAGGNTALSTGELRRGTNGNDTIITNTIGTTIFNAKGGGGGGAWGGVDAGLNGGSGGGSTNTSAAGTVVTTNVPQDANVFGNSGGVAPPHSASITAGAGGGGAGAAGSTGSVSGNGNGGNGGIGKIINITGISNYYAGGGGGCLYKTSASGTAGIGGLGGGGNGSFTVNTTGNGINGTANTGGGGGGASGPGGSGGIGGIGGSGVVIIRYLNSSSNLFTSNINSLVVPINSIVKINNTCNININNGIYDINFQNGLISINYIFNNKSFPLLKDINNNDINPYIWYKFDNISNIGLDNSCNYNLTNYNTVFNSNDFIKSFGSASFNGSNQYLNLSNCFTRYNTGSIYINNSNYNSIKQYFQISSLSPLYLNTINTTNGISLSFWVKLSSSSLDNCRILYFGNYQKVFPYYNNTNYRIQIRTSIPKTSTVYFEIIKDVNYLFQYNINLFDNTWKHIVWTISSGGIWNIYINNVKICDNQLNVIIPEFSSTNLNYLFGMDNSSNNNGIIGNFDDFRIYDSVLSSFSVNNLYNSKINNNQIVDINLNSKYILSSKSSNLFNPFLITFNSNTELISIMNNSTSNSILIQSNMNFITNNINNFVINNNFINIKNSLNILGNSNNNKNGGAYFNTDSTPNYYTNYNPNLTSYSLYTIDNIICGKNSFALSDKRIKSNIIDINDETALNKILDIEPKTYRYVDNIQRSSSNVYGFIAQQIRDVLPEATELTSKFIPNIFKLTKINGNKINIYHDDLNIGDKILIYTKNKSYEVNVISKDMNGFEINEIINENDIFIYGKFVNDFHIIDKSYLYTLNICATQELARIVEGLKERINR